MLLDVLGICYKPNARASLEGYDEAFIDNDRDHKITPHHFRAYNCTSCEAKNFVTEIHWQRKIQCHSCDYVGVLPGVTEARMCAPLLGLTKYPRKCGCSECKSGQEVLVPTFEIAENPQFRISKLIEVDQAAKRG